MQRSAKIRREIMAMTPPLASPTMPTFYDEETDEASSSDPSSSSSSTSSCQDDQDDCAYWADTGECTNNAA